MVCLKPPVWRRLRVTPKPEEPDDSLQADHANPTRRLIRLRTAELSLGPHDTTCPATDARHNGSILPTIGRVFNQKVPSNTFSKIYARRTALRIILFDIEHAPSIPQNQANKRAERLDTPQNNGPTPPLVCYGRKRDE